MADEKDEALEEESESKSSVGDIFGVSAGKKKSKKKKQKKVDPPPPAEEGFGEDEAVAAEVGAEESVPLSEQRQSGDVEKALEAATKPAPAPPKKKKKEAKSAALDGVLLPSSEAAPKMETDDYLGASDLGDYEAPSSKAVPVLVGIVVVLVLVILGGGVYFGGLGGDLAALFKGELREKRIAEARMEEEQFKADQLAKLDLFGNLMISGNPQYALVKLNGQVQYGKTSQGWREVRVGTTGGVQDLKVKENHQVEFSAPGFEPSTIEITEGKWQEHAGAYSYSVSPSLVPASIHAKQEFDARMSQDVENEFFGEITLNTTPSGATVIINNQPLLDEKGEELKTPVTFEKYWVKDEESGKLEEKELKVDTALDVGHKVQLKMDYENSCPEQGEGQTAIACGKADNCCPDDCTVATDSDCKWPAYVTSLTRPMWTCTWNTDDGQPPAEVPKGKSIQHFCDYTFALDVDFNNLKSYIIAREEERQRIMEQYKAAAGPDAGMPEGAETAQSN